MKETMIDTEVTYTLFHEGNFYVIEHVPARVCRVTGEEFFAPETVERIQALVKGKKKPDRTVRTPVYEYA
jgi:YgiT-type zinc finger domain-containing protein